ncbi:hypothetical protein C900_05926 [Fulvivirga imtechensis AK7]|uniref:Uncharacterized protein n=1 Tax=Fulvivirga imtechensis AK7 TaxID=1237149 RepID=L8JIH9_9BACT|nr:hypothetical protein C900_05926 [Fulvivirga imtechensis AK7]
MSKFIYGIRLTVKMLVILRLELEITYMAIIQRMLMEMGLIL